MRRRVAGFGALGTLLTLTAAAVVFAPGLVRGVGPLAGVVRTLGEADERQLLLLASLVVGLSVSLVSWRAARSARAERDAFDEATEGPPEAVTTARQALTAADLEGSFDAAVDGDEAAVESVRDRLRETATRYYARSVGCEERAARTAVLHGNWTDERTAAALLADDGPTHSLGSRLRLWLDPESERERRFDATVRAIRRLGTDEPSEAVRRTQSAVRDDEGGSRSRPSAAPDVDGGER